ncbi:Protein TolB-like protein [Colletotrichum spinosum]|uniref:Protein TolB-like protein n=1 Tax=Colletotrichum spinosum TaxID=1347390 RepID=A0A4R8Q1I9_9PEZI|nr:Protein TolB-like protein [Colletotrichum spinosum]
MNRIGPSSSELYVANADGTDERKLLGSASSFEYHAAFSPDGTKLAYVSTENGYRANIWVLDLATGERRNLTNTPEVAGDPLLPDGHFRPSWSPDGGWIAFASDRNTPWRGHGNGTGWEHTQELSVYAIRPDGTGFRQIATKPGYCLGSPRWSPDGKRVVYYELTTEDTWNAHRPESVAAVTSQIVSVDFETGSDRAEHTSSSGLKMFPQWLPGSSNTTTDDIAYLIKGTDDEGFNYTSGSIPAVKAAVRSPAWSPDGKLVVYEKVAFAARPMEKPLYSWDEDWEYRSTDVFPQLSLQGRLVLTQKQLGNSSIVSMNPDGTDVELVFDSSSTGEVDAALVARGLAGAFQPSWSADGEWVAFTRKVDAAKFDVCTIRPDGSGLRVLTSSGANDAHAVWTADGRILYSSGMYGFRDEAAAYDQTFQPYGQIVVMDADGANKRMLTDSLWEDSMPLYVPNEFLV